MISLSCELKWTVFLRAKNMSQPKSLADLKVLCTRKDKLKAVNKDVIAEILLHDEAGNSGDGNDDIRTLLKKLSGDVIEMKEANRKVLDAVEKVTKLEVQVEKLESENRKMTETLSYQQRFIESLDAKERERNIIMTGVSENSNELGENDGEKVTSILDAINAAEATRNMTVQRIGREMENRKRPILVSFVDNKTRQDVLEKAKILKDKDIPFKSVYIKKDIHPSIRKEYDRLRRVERSEKAKPENAGKTVVYDRKERVIKCDGAIIDKFKPTFS